MVEMHGILFAKAKMLLYLRVSLRFDHSTLPTEDECNINEPLLHFRWSKLYSKFKIPIFWWCAYWSTVKWAINSVLKIDLSDLKINHLKCFVTSSLSNFHHPSAKIVRQPGQPVSDIRFKSLAMAISEKKNYKQIATLVDRDPKELGCLRVLFLFFLKVW